MINISRDAVLNVKSRSRSYPMHRFLFVSLERKMSELKPLLLGSMFAVLVVSAALAQATIDVGKITCDRYVADKADARTVAVWLNGFYAGRRNNTGRKWAFPQAGLPRRASVYWMVGVPGLEPGTR